MVGTPQLSAVNEVKKHLSKTIDECYNKFENYQVQTGLELISQAYYLLHDEVYKLWTDGKRILAFPNGNIQEERNEESIKLLKKIADETWNSPPRLPSNSLHLDEIEEMNLTNMQEAVMKAVINASMTHGSNHSHAKRWKCGNNHIHKKAESLSETLVGIQNTI
ncbi:hypothetical protein Gotur_034472, partial [Gossypium turneri]